MPKVRVPKSAGEEITLTRGGESKTYRVTDGQVTVASDDLDNFLRAVPGAEAPKSGGSPAAKREE